MGFCFTVVNVLLHIFIVTFGYLLSILPEVILSDVSFILTSISANILVNANCTELALPLFCIDHNGRVLVVMFVASKITELGLIPDW